MTPSDRCDLKDGTMLKLLKPERFPDRKVYPPGLKALRQPKTGNSVFLFSYGIPARAK